MSKLNKKNVEDLNVKGKKVLVRVDFNVPLLLPCKCVVNGGQPFCYILMYRGFAHAERFGCLSDGCIVLHDIICNTDRSFFNIFFQRKSP